MNCSDWEREIASESGAAGLEAHLQQCARCREFAREIEANRAAMQQLTVHPAAFAAVRRRVLDDIQSRRRRAIWWQVPAAAAILVACGVILSVIFLQPRTKPGIAKPPVVAVRTPPQVTAPARNVARSPRRPRPRAHVVPARMAVHARQESLTVKMLTNDPDVIIIWLVDQKGD